MLGLGVLQWVWACESDLRELRSRVQVEVARGLWSFDVWFCLE